jgi:hypothetical protein
MAIKKRIYMLKDASETVGIYTRNLPAKTWQSVEESQANTLIESGLARDSEDVREVGKGRNRRKTTAVPSPREVDTPETDDADADVPSQE